MKAIIVGFLITLVLLLFIHFDVYNYLSLDGLNKYKNILLSYREQPLFILLFIVCYISLLALCLPGTSILDIFVGFTYNIYIALFLILFSRIMGAITNFLTARYLLKDLLAKKFGQLKQIIYRKDEKQLLVNLIKLRLIPIIPFWLINVVSALIDVRLRLLITATAIGVVPLSLLHIFIGRKISNIKHISINYIFETKAIISCFCLLFLVTLPYICKFIYRKYQAYYK